MKLVKYKFFFSWQFEERERWINEMSSNGWQLEKFKFSVFTFKKSEPGEYIYRCQLLSTGLEVDFDDYFRFMEQIGAELVGRHNNQACFRKKASEGPFELFSDTPTRIKHLRKLMTPAVMFGVFNTSMGVKDLLFKPKMPVFGAAADLTVHILALVTGVFSLWCFIMLLLKYLKLKKQHNLYE